MDRIKELFDACNSTADLANAARQLRDEGENLSKINVARMTRLKELATMQSASYNKIPKSIFNVLISSEPYSNLTFDTTLLNYPSIIVAGDAIVI